VREKSECQGGGEGWVNSAPAYAILFIFASHTKALVQFIKFTLFSFKGMGNFQQDGVIVYFTRQSSKRQSK